MRFYRAISTVKAMTFDLDDTLYDNGPVIRQAEAALNAHLAENHPATASMPLESWQSIKHHLIATTPGLSSDMAQLRLRTLTTALAQEIDDPQERHVAAKISYDCFYSARSEFSIDEHVHETLAALSARVPLIGITNGNVDTVKTGIKPYFKAVFHASLARPMKPSSHMFDEAVTLAGVPAKHILHVGDNLEKDVMGAINAGLQAAWFACNRPMELHRETLSVLPHVQLDHFAELLEF